MCLDSAATQLLFSLLYLPLTAFPRLSPLPSASLIFLARSSLFLAPVLHLPSLVRSHLAPDTPRDILTTFILNLFSVYIIQSTKVFFGLIVRLLLANSLSHLIASGPTLKFVFHHGPLL